MLLFFSNFCSRIKHPFKIFFFLFWIDDDAFGFMFSQFLIASAEIVFCFC